MLLGRRSLGVQYEPQLRHLIEHLLTRLGMLTYYWPCSQCSCHSCCCCCIAVARCQLPVARSLYGYGVQDIGMGIACVSSSASVSEVCSYLTVKAFIIIRLNLKTFWLGLSCWLCCVKTNYISAQALTPFVCAYVVVAIVVLVLDVAVAVVLVSMLLLLLIDADVVAMLLLANCESARKIQLCHWQTNWLFNFCESLLSALSLPLSSYLFLCRWAVRKLQIKNISAIANNCSIKLCWLEADSATIWERTW